MSQDLNTPIWQLTTGEFFDLVQRAMKQGDVGSVVEKNIDKDEYRKGIMGIASIFGCERGVAQKLKSSGKLDPAIVQVGRSITINVRIARELHSLDKKKPKR